MHTIVMLTAGFALLTVFLILGHRSGGNASMAHAALAFIPIWLLATAANLGIGVSRAGYTVREELPIFLLLFTAPATASIVAWWRIRNGG